MTISLGSSVQCETMNLTHVQTSTITSQSVSAATGSVVNNLAVGSLTVGSLDLKSVATSSDYADLINVPLVDATPIQDSLNLIKSGGVKQAFEDLESTVYLPWKISTTKGDR